MLRRALILTLTAGLATPVLAQDMMTARASFIDSEGEEIGTAALSETPTGVLINVEVTDLPAGEHGFHIHETGSCETPDFQSAGGHYAPRGNQHGFLVEGGPHAGDMPNQFVQDDGVLRAHIRNDRVTLGEGEGTLFDEDGSAFIIHADADDYSSQPSGNAGPRLACAVIERDS